jgi:hypothetical protein
MNGSATFTHDPGSVQQTWRQFYNGPNAGLIDVELARREMPGLIGEAATVVFNPPVASGTMPVCGEPEGE